MRIAVLGAGAMGSWFGGKLALHGSTVQLLTTNKAHTSAISASGLQLQAKGEQQSLTIAAHPPEQIKGPVDLVLLFTKSFQSDAAMSSISHAIDDNTHVLSLQNGLGNAELIVKYVPENRIFIGVTMMPVDKIGPGIVACKGDGPSYFGPAFTLHSETPSSQAEQILAAFAPTGLSLTYDSDIHKRIWEKVAFNAGMNSLAALAHGTPGTIGQSMGAKELAQNVACEVAAVAETVGVQVNLETVFSIIDFACTNHPDHKPSMLQDLNAKKQTEIDSLCGAVVRLARDRDIPVPLNTMLTTLVKLAELSHQRYD